MIDKKQIKVFKKMKIVKFFNKNFLIIVYLTLELSLS